VLIPVAEVSSGAASYLGVHAQSNSNVLDDENVDVICTVYDVQGKVTTREALPAIRPTKVRVQGSGA